MTNERAIELLNRISDSQFDGVHGDERREALEMAVKAMEALGQVATDINVGDTISRQAAIDAVAKWFHDDVFGITESDGTVTIFKRLRELPSEQPERKKGRWKLLYDNIWICTNCEQTEQFGVNIESTSDYCPSCGADMRGESDE